MLPTEWWDIVVMTMIVLAVGAGTWGIAAVIPKYLSLRLL